MKRSDILRQWMMAFQKAGLVTGSVEAQATIAECAVREVVARYGREPLTGESPENE